MNLKETDLNLFIAFDVIYTEKNLTKAGQVLGITQPAVSNALSRLRELFDDELFIRTSKGMIPTPVANQIINDVRSALSLIQNTISEAESRGVSVMPKPMVTYTLIFTSKMHGKIFAIKKGIPPINLYINIKLNSFFLNLSLSLENLL